MRTFPQIGIGAAAQFPFEKEIAYRTAVNSPRSAAQIVYADPDYEERRWRLPLQSLTDEEWQLIEDLFTDACGRFGSFVFLEPGSNLLSWSKDLTDPVWAASTLTITGEQQDPSGSPDAWLLSSSGPGALSQTLAAPSNFVYSGSCSIRTEEPGVQLCLRDESIVQSVEPVAADGTWRRYEVALQGAPGGESVTFEISLPAGATAEVFGPQLEGQASASLYKPTTGQAGLFSFTRFDQDRLPDRMIGPGSHSGEIQLIWTPSLS